MRNSTGYLNKILSLYSLLLLTFLYPTKTFAQTNFDISVQYTHTVATENVQTEAMLTISSDIDRVLTYYTATIPLDNLNVECLSETRSSLDCEVYSRDGVTDVQIDANNQIIKVEDPLKIFLVYNQPIDDDNSYNISSYIEDTISSKVTVNYPKEKGEPLWASDSINSIKTSGDRYMLSIVNPKSETTSVVFGEKVVYQFKISKVLNNTLTKESQNFEILIPSDTEKQTVIFETIDPLPNIATRDKEGNYTLKYTLQPKKSLDISIEGWIEFSNKAIETSSESLQRLTESEGYWELQDSTEIVRIRKFIKDSGIKIPDVFTNIEDLEEDIDTDLIFKALSNYTKERLSIKENLELGIGTKRLGAKAALETSYSATQEDYADLMIAILREFNIPSRMKIGYISSISGYTSDGFYHTWTEAYDAQEDKWKILDPFLEDHFQKQLYGSDFLDHISIVTRGTSPVSPRLTFYTNNDFTVTYSSKNLPTSNIDAELSLEIENLNPLHKYTEGRIQFSNTGNVAITAYDITKSNIDIDQHIDYVNNLNSQIILPKQNGEIAFHIPTNILEETAYANITLSNGSLQKQFLTETSVDSNQISFISVLSKLVSVTIFSAILYLIYFLINKRRKK